MRLLIGHRSPGSAFVRDGHPYAFGQTCKIRYWVEHNPSRGFRMCYQTCLDGRWNKSKGSAWQVLVVLVEDDQGHVVCDRLSSTVPGDVMAFEQKYGPALAFEPEQSVLRAIWKAVERRQQTEKLAA